MCRLWSGLMTRLVRQASTHFFACGKRGLCQTHFKNLVLAHITRFCKDAVHTSCKNINQWVTSFPVRENMPLVLGVMSMSGLKNYWPRVVNHQGACVTHAGARLIGTPRTAVTEGGSGCGMRQISRAVRRPRTGIAEGAADHDRHESDLLDAYNWKSLGWRRICRAMWKGVCTVLASGPEVLRVRSLTRWGSLYISCPRPSR